MIFFISWPEIILINMTTAKNLPELTDKMKEY